MKENIKAAENDLDNEISGFSDIVEMFDEYEDVEYIRNEQTPFIISNNEKLRNVIEENKIEDDKPSKTNTSIVNNFGIRTNKEHEQTNDNQYTSNYQNKFPDFFIEEVLFYIENNDKNISKIENSPENKDLYNKEHSLEEASRVIKNEKGDFYKIHRTQELYKNEHPLEPAYKESNYITISEFDPNFTPFYQEKPMKKTIINDYYKRNNVTTISVQGNEVKILKTDSRDTFQHYKNEGKNNIKDESISFDTTDFNSDEDEGMSFIHDCNNLERKINESNIQLKDFKDELLLVSKTVTRSVELRNESIYHLDQYNSNFFEWCKYMKDYISLLISPKIEFTTSNWLQIEEKSLQKAIKFKTETMEQNMLVEDGSLNNRENINGKKVYILDSSDSIESEMCELPYIDPMYEYLLKEKSNNYDDLNYVVMYFSNCNKINTINKIKVYRKDIQCLLNNNWLNDKIINTFFDLLSRHYNVLKEEESNFQLSLDKLFVRIKNKEKKDIYNKYFGNNEVKNVHFTTMNISEKSIYDTQERYIQNFSDKERRKISFDRIKSFKIKFSNEIYVLTTFFFTFLKKRGASYLSDTWFKSINLIAYKKVLIPIHLGSHWIFCVVDNQNLTIQIYDSLLNRHHSTSKRISLFFEGEYKKHHDIDVNYLIIYQFEIPTQSNGYDCGAYILYYAKRIFEKKEIKLERVEMNIFRKMIFHEIAVGRILYSTNEISNYTKLKKFKPFWSSKYFQ